MSKTFNTLGNDTVDAFFNHLGFQAYSNCRVRSSSPFKDYADLTSAVRISDEILLRSWSMAHQGLEYQVQSASRTSLKSYAR